MTRLLSITNLIGAIKEADITSLIVQSEALMKFALITNLVVKKQMKRIRKRKEKEKQRVSREEGPTRSFKNERVALVDKLIGASGLLQELAHYVSQP